MFKKSLPILKHIFHAFRAVLGVILLLPILAYMVWFNYTVDRAGLFQGDQYERDIVEMLLNGEDIFGYEQLQERSLTKLIIKNMEKAPNTIAVGSSRVMQISTREAGTKDFFNFGMSGGDYKDLFNTYYLFTKYDKLPENIIIGFDPWLLKESGIDKRSDGELYAEYLSFMGESIELEGKDESEKWNELFSPAYFQGCVEYYNRDKTKDMHPTGVVGDINMQTSEIKRSDGSVVYTNEYRSASSDSIASRALVHSQSFLRMDYYNEPSELLLNQFDKFLYLADKQNINVYFLLTPYHHTLWDVVSRKQSLYPGFFKTEAAVRELAAKHKIPVYGSYNPYALDGIERTDFYDGLHITGDGITKIFPGIQKAKSDLKHGIFPPVPPYDTNGMPSEADKDAWI